MTERDEHIKMILAVIPEKPGCYQYFDEKGTIIYVGKAVNLKNRVRSYFRCLLYTSPSPRDRQKSRMPSSA